MRKYSNGVSVHLSKGSLRKMYGLLLVAVETYCCSQTKTEVRGRKFGKKPAVLDSSNIFPYLRLLCTAAGDRPRHVTAALPVILRHCLCLANDMAHLTAGGPPEKCSGFCCSM